MTDFTTNPTGGFAMAAKPKSPLGAIMAIAGLTSGMLGGYSLVFGLDAISSYGSTTLWDFGLLLSAVTWLCLFVSVVAELVSWSKGHRPQWWLVGIFVLFLLATYHGYKAL